MIKKMYYKWLRKVLIDFVTDLYYVDKQVQKDVGISMVDKYIKSIKDNKKRS